MIPTKSYAAANAKSGLSAFNFEREAPRDNEIQIEVLFCGVCHSDIHQLKNEWGNTVYPCVPGHEVVGRVTAKGQAVTAHAIGDMVGIGCMIDSCRHCEACAAGQENYCQGPNSWLATYNGPMKPAAMTPDKRNTYGRDNTFGGYSSSLVVPEDFVLKIPAGMRPEIAAPILCAGVTTYSPLRFWNVKPGQKVGVIGFGGLGHMAIQIARAMGAEVVVFTRTEEKLNEAKQFGATAVMESDKKAFAAMTSQFDFILSTVPQKHNLNPFAVLLKRTCTICVVGALEPMDPVNNMLLASQRKHIAGSLIGSIAETQEVLNFCAEHRIGPDIEVIDIQDINTAIEKVESGDVRFRYVIDMASLG